MKKYLKTHMHYYVVLLLSQAVFFYAAYATSGNKNLQHGVLFISSFSYASWAIWHHYRDHSLTLKIVVEYLLFGTFGIITSFLYFK